MLPVIAYVRVLAVDFASRVPLGIDKTPRRIAMAMPNPLRLPPILICCTMSMFGQGYVHGTAIAVIRTDDAVSIAADSRTVDRDGKRMPDSCKILGAGGYFFSLHGTVSDKIISSIRRTLASASGDLFEKAQAIRSTVLPLIIPGMIADPGSSGIFLLGSEGGQPKLAYIKFDPLAPGEPVIRYCPGADCLNGIATAQATVYGGVLSTNARNVDDVRNLVWGEIRTGQSEEERTHRISAVGEPLESLVVHRDGKHERPDNPDVCKNEP